MFSKKLSMLAATTVAVAGLSVSAFAGGPTTEMPMASAPSDTGFTLGLQYANYVANTFAPMLGYVNPDFLIDIGASYNNISYVSSRNNGITFIRGDIGLRHSLMQALYFTYGAAASVGIISGSKRGLQNPYTAGAFVGLDYQPMSNLLVSFKILPYNYMRGVVNTNNNSHNNVFGDGSIGAAYVFAQ